MKDENFSERLTLAHPQRSSIGSKRPQRGEIEIEIDE